MHKEWVNGVSGNTNNCGVKIDAFKKILKASLLENYKF